MEILQLKKTLMYKCDETLCITCQKQKDTELTSTASGQTQVRKATEIYQDIVWDKFKSGDKDFFYYHVDNLCYKSYMHPKNLNTSQYRPSCNRFFTVYL